MKKIYLVFYVLLFSVFVSSTPVPAVLAACPGDPNCPDLTTKTTTPQTSSGSVSLENPLGEKTTVEEIIGRVISAALGVVGSLALLMFIYGGFTWMMAGGNTEAVTKGRNILMWAAIGLVVIFTSYTLVRFVITSLAP